MALVQILQAQGQIPVTVFQLQDRIHLGNYQELEQIAGITGSIEICDTVEEAVASF